MRCTLGMGGCLLAMALLDGGGLFSAEPKVETPQVVIEHELRDVEGWPVLVDRRLLDGAEAELGAEALKVLQHELYELSLVVPAEKVAEMRKVRIYLDLDHPLNALQYHPGAGWLKDHGYDVAMEKAVHIPKAKSLISHSKKNEQPWVMLHELAHAYHDQVLGFDNVPIMKAFEKAKASGKYEKVLHIRGHKTKHYALTNHKEYFAEMSESYFGTNDFYPFVLGELKESDVDTYEMLTDIWGKR
ncbi:MAG: metallopeptidase [Planctomycetaceae bacterium]